MGQKVSPPVHRWLWPGHLCQGRTVIVPFTMSCYFGFANVGAFHDALRPLQWLKQGNRFLHMLAFHCAGIHYLLHILTTTWLNFCVFLAFAFCDGVFGARPYVSFSSFSPTPSTSACFFFVHGHLSPACPDIFYFLVIRVAGGVGIYFSLHSNRNLNLIHSDSSSC